MLIAQHRDTLRYAEVRSGSYAPRLFDLQPKAFVYLSEYRASDFFYKLRPSQQINPEFPSLNWPRYPNLKLRYISPL